MNPTTQPETESQTPGKWDRLAWLPIILLLAAIIAARMAGLRHSYESHTLLLVLSFTFYTLVSLGTLYLIGRSFLALGSPGLLLLECGVVLWSMAGTVGDFVSHGDANINVTIFNIGILLAGLCHLAGALLSLSQQRVLSSRPVWLGAGSAFALGALWLVSQAALSGWLPVFFVPGHGGTLVRYSVLVSAIAMFVLSAGVLRANQRAARLPFTSWYSLALLLLAVGLFGVMIQLSLGSVVNWLSRTAQWLGGLYLLFAASASLRESELPLFPPEKKSHPAYYRDAVAVAVVLAAAAIRLAFLSAMGAQAPFLVFFPAVMFAAIYGGLRSGLLATGLSAILAYYFWIEPAGQFTIGQPSDWLALVIFLLSGAMIAWVADSIHRARGRASAAETQALLATERLAAAEILQESEERYHTLFTGMTEGFAIHELLTDESGKPVDYRFLDVNPAFERLTGLKRQDVVGKTHNEALPGNDPKWLQMYSQVALTGQPVQFENYAPVLKRHYAVFAYRPAPMQFAVIFMDITERKQAEEALRESEQRWATTLVSIGDAVIATDVEARITFMNAVAEELTGWTLSEAVAGPVTTVFNIVNEQTRRKAENPVARVLEQGNIVGLANHTLLVRRDGTEVPIDDSGAPIRDPNGKTMGVVLVFRDITERKKTEQALRESEAKANALIKYAPTGIYEIDYRGPRFISVNEAMCQILGYAREELFSIGPSALLDGNGRAIFADRIRRELAGEKVEESVEYRVRKKDGSFIDAILNVTLNVAGDEPSRALVVAYDITERKRMEEELRRSRDELELRVQERTAEICHQAELLDLAHDAIIVREMDGAITFWNEGATEMYGWRKEEALGKISCDLLETEFPVSRDENMTKVVQEGRWEGELTHTRKDGKKINVLSRWALQKDEEGRPTGIMQINHDITQRLKLEEQLRQAQKLEAIGTLTGGIAHDFNNILGAVVINSEMALLGLPGESGLHSNLDLILNAGLRGRDLVTQMLLFSRKSEKKQEVLTLTPLIKETFKLLRSSLPTTIQMKLILETESDAVSADPSQIQQVIMNLCTNAAYAMRGTTGSIDISLQGITFGSTDLPEADMQPGDYLVLSVKDTGSGMDEEVKKRIFEPFFTTKPVGEGTGLGLSVVYGIVKNHKGNITVYSEPGKGSIFKVYLPRVDSRTSVVQETPKPIPRGNERILLVDDEDFNIKTVQNMLQHLGYKVTALMDSEEALKLFSADPSQFDLVITDQTMPFMTGEDLGKEFMRMRPDIPVILCTGYSDLISSEKAAALGFRGYITKPFTVREGAELVRRVLDQK